MNFRNNTLLLISFILFLNSPCAAQTSKLDRNGEPDIYFVEEEDKDMNQAIKMARETLNDFYSKFDKDKKNQKVYFSIKVAFDSDDSSVEHIWLGNIQIKEDKMYGEVGNAPDAVSNLTLGQRVEINKNRISDWMIIENNKLIGGYTIRAIRNRMSKSEKAEFDRQFGVTIE